MIFVILGEKYDFRAIRNEVARVIELIDAFDEAGGRLRDPQAKD